MKLTRVELVDYSCFEKVSFDLVGEGKLGVDPVCDRCGAVTSFFPPRPMLGQRPVWSLAALAGPCLHGPG